MEAVPTTSEPFAPTTPELLENFRQDLIDFRDIKTPGNSTVWKTLADVCIDALDEEKGIPAFQQTMVDFLQARPDDPENPDKFKQYRVLLLVKELQYFQMRDPEYPRGYDDYGKMRQSLEAIFDDEIKTETLGSMLRFIQNQATVPSRYAGPKLAISLFEEHLAQPASLVDFFSSAGISAIALKDNLPIFKPELIDVTPDERRVISGMLAGRIALGQVVGFDLFPETDLARIKAHSHYPEELNDPSKVKLFDYLFGIRSKMIRLIQGDMTDPNDTGLAKLNERFRGGQADISTALTGYYELDDEAIGQAMRSQSALTRSLEIVFDFCDQDPKDPSRLIFKHDIHDADSHYRLFAKLKQGPDASNDWLHLGDADNGRVKAFTPSDLTKELIAHRIRGRQD